MRNALRLLAFLLLTLVPACANLNMFSDEYMNALGVQAYAEETKSAVEIKTGADYEMVQRVGQKIAAASEASFAWEFKLLKADKEANAFCLPGGKVAIYTGILPTTMNESGLAAVMGHEVAHAILRHGGKRMTQEALLSVALGAVQEGMSLSEMSKESRELTMLALGVGSRLGMLLPYSRGHETEADIDGLRYAIRAGYDPWEAPKLWERMSKLGGGGTPVWLSTHPAPDARAAYLRELIPQLTAQEQQWRPKSVTPVLKVATGSRQ